MHPSQTATHHHFRSHPPLPPHPLLKLRGCANNSPQQWHPSSGHVANIPVDSPGGGHLTSVAASPTPSRPADNSPSCKGPGASSPAGTAQAGWPSCLPGALDSASRALASGHRSKEAIDQQQLQQSVLQHAGLQQQHELSSALFSGCDDDRQRSRQAAASQGHEEPNQHQQDQSDSGSKHSEVFQCESAGAVGDDELLDHEPDMTRSDANAQGAAADQPGYSTYLWPGAQLGYPGHSAEQDCAVSNSQTQGHSSMMTQHQQESPRALPHHFVAGQGFAQQQRPAAYPQQWPNQAMAPIVRHGQMQPGLGRGRREEHEICRGSMLHEAYRATNTATDGEADQQRECFAQSSVEAVPQPMPAFRISTKVRYKMIHSSCVALVPSSNSIMQQYHPTVSCNSIMHMVCTSNSCSYAHPCVAIIVSTTCFSSVWCLSLCVPPHFAKQVEHCNLTCM